jgi:hypothetical protein
METQKENPVTGREGSPIKLDVAASWTKNYREKHPGETISQFFGKEILEKILAQENCLGIRFYYAHDKPLNGWQRFTVSVSNFILKVIGNIDGEKHLIITGVVSDGNDQLSEKGLEEAVTAPASESMTAAAPAPKLMAVTAPAYTVGEQSSPCPGSPGCPKNVLTGGN